MKLLQYICVQPYLIYYSWQVDVMLNNFTEVGINQSDIHILLSYDSEVDIKTHYVWNKVIEKYKDVNFYFYPDLRKHKNYPSSIRPNVLAQFYKDYPEFSENVVFYHDCDILFTKTPDFSKFINDNNWYLSDTVSYISSDYVKSKEYGVYEKMCDIVGIDKSIPEKNNRDSGGAQYIIKDVDHTFWERVEIDSENLFREITIINNDIKKEKPEYHELQIWCADMWALLWNVWKNGIKTQVVDEMNFSWATSHISEWDKNTIYHNAGVDSNMRYLFNKSNYQSDLPVNLDLSKVDNSYCSYKYAKKVANIMNIYDNDYPFISAKCITYGRVDMLEESIYSFINQNYPGKKELIIVNDYPLQKLVFDHPEVKIYNLSETFSTIGEKENFAMSKCSADIICQWDDDDIALSNHLTNVAKYFVKDTDLLFWNNGVFYNEPNISAITSLGHSGMVFSKKIWKKVGGYPLENAGYDMSYVTNIKQNSKNIVFANPIDKEVSWFYMWGGRGYHMSGQGTDSPNRANIIERHTEHIENLRVNGLIPIGDINLKPNWKINYKKLLNDYINNMI